jgi:hypothetical protein
MEGHSARNPCRGILSVIAIYQQLGTKRSRDHERFDA